MADYIKPTSDIFIRFLLGSEHNKDLLLDFINAVLEDADFPLVESVEILNPFNLKQFTYDKESILDVKAVDSHGRIFNIEIQAMGNELFVNRSIYYWAKNYTGQLEQGEEYRSLNPVICINILEFPLIANSDKTHTTFLLLEKDNQDIRLSDHLEIHFLEIPKFNDKQAELKDVLKQWLLYFKCEGREEETMRTILENSENLKKAHEQYMNFTGNSEYREAYEARRKWELDQNTLIYSAEQKGIEKGIEKGKIETARMMIKEGDPIEKVSRVTGLSQKEIDKL
jgi:predicted transposase/invertase (TIGR01784 family)